MSSHLRSSGALKNVDLMQRKKVNMYLITFVIWLLPRKNIYWKCDNLCVYESLCYALIAENSFEFALSVEKWVTLVCIDYHTSRTFFLLRCYYCAENINQSFKPVIRKFSLRYSDCMRNKVIISILESTLYTMLVLYTGGFSLNTPVFASDQTPFDLTWVWYVIFRSMQWVKHVTSCL